MRILWSYVYFFETYLYTNEKGKQRSKRQENKSKNQIMTKP